MSENEKGRMMQTYTHYKDLWSEKQKFYRTKYYFMRFVWESLLENIPARLSFHYFKFKIKILFHGCLA